MSHGTRKAIGGVQKWETRTAENVSEFIRRYEGAQSQADIDAISEWAKVFNWFLRTPDQDVQMKQAFFAAKRRLK